MQTFEDEIKNIKWLNREPYPLDLAFLKTSDEKAWLEQAQYIQENLSDADIDAAFHNLPTAVQDGTVEEIKRKLKARKNQLQRYASDYYKVLQKTVLIIGTNKDDQFIIDQKANNELEVAVYRLKKEGKEFIHTKEFTADQTKNIWIYGLDGEDVFEVKGSAQSAIAIRLIGGQNKDSYAVENGKKVKINDFKTKTNAYQLDSKTKLLLSDDYTTNLYDYKKPKYNAFSGLPNIGYNPDDGGKLGLI